MYRGRRRCRLILTHGNRSGRERSGCPERREDVAHSASGGDAKNACIVPPSPPPSPRSGSSRRASASLAKRRVCVRDAFWMMRSVWMDGWMKWDLTEHRSACVRARACVCVCAGAVLAAVCVQCGLQPYFCLSGNSVNGAIKKTNFPCRREEEYDIVRYRKL